MSRRTVHTSERTYLFSPDALPLQGDRIWALAKVRLIDETNGQPPEGRSMIRTPLRKVITRVGPDGLGGVVGIPRDVFPRLDAQLYTVPLTIISEGYVTQRVDVDVPMDINFPASFSPPPLRDVFLHREPTIISGRVMRTNGGSIIPAPGATVSITGIWRTPPPANSSIPASAPSVVSLRPPLYAGRKPVVDHLHRHNLGTFAGNKFMIDDAQQGSATVRLSDQVSLAPGDILLIDANEPDLIEFISVKSITGAGTPDQPATIILDYPLSYEHRRNAVVLRVNPAGLGPVRQIADEALAGDTCVFLNTLTGLGVATEVELNGTGANEYHSLNRFLVTSDADGYYRLPPISRIAQMVIEGEKVVGPQTFATKTTFRPDYSKRENTLDLTLIV